MNYSDDDEFIYAVESCSIDAFHHRDHIRLAWLYCERYGIPEASRRIVETIRRLAAHAGHPNKYHHTMTLAWMRLVDAARSSGAPQMEEHATLMNKDALSAHYSAEALASPAARSGWMEPDRAPLP